MPPPPHAWTVQTRLEPGADVITLVIAGRLGAAGAAEVRAALDAAVSGGGLVRLDLSAIDYISSAGIAVLRDAARTLRSAGGTLVIAEASAIVMLAFHLAGDPDGLAPPASASRAVTPDQ
ncbi:MAG: STAS domain-containing protein [Vicinamibacterales bacterium]